MMAWPHEHHAIVDGAHGFLTQHSWYRQLVDLEWKFGVTASTDDVMSVGATYLQMKLVIDRGSGQVGVVAPHACTFAP